MRKVLLLMTTGYQAVTGRPGRDEGADQLDTSSHGRSLVPFHDNWFRPNALINHVEELGLGNKEI